jgi:hypothetical protein
VVTAPRGRSAARLLRRGVRCGGLALLLTARSPLLAPGTAQARVDSAWGQFPGQPAAAIGVRRRVRFS